MAEEYPDDYIVDDTADGGTPPPFEEPDDAETALVAVEFSEPAPPPRAAFDPAKEPWRRWVEENILGLKANTDGLVSANRSLTLGHVAMATQLEEQSATVDDISAATEEHAGIILSNLPPSPPTDPLITSDRGQVVIAWDGLLMMMNTDGNLSPRPPGAAFVGVVVEMSDVEPTLPPNVIDPDPAEEPEEDLPLVEDGGIYDPENGGAVPEGDVMVIDMVFPDEDSDPDPDPNPTPEPDQPWVDPTPWVQVGQTLNAGGSVIVAPPVGEVRWFRLISIDNQGRRSEGSAIGEIEVVPAGFDDLDKAVQDHINDAYNMGDEALTQVVNSIASSVDEYIVSDSNTIQPNPLDPGWSSDTPDWEPGQYVWRRTRTTTIGGDQAIGSPSVITGNDGTPGEDAVLLRLSSSNGLLFKHSQIATTLRVTVMKGSMMITNITDLRAVFGNGAYLEWFWRRGNETTWSVISSADSRFGESGFTFTVSPAEVPERTSFEARLVT